MDFEIGREELKRKIDRGEPLVLVEAQAPIAYEAAHLPGALNLPPGRVAELAPALLPEKEIEIVVYCSGPT
jgi:rhodanese-related sulfurtransferase